MCHKYQVRNGTELEFVYGEYLKAKENGSVKSKVLSNYRTIAGF